MPFSLLPTMLTDALTDLTPALLAKNNIQLLMLDFDNTILPYTADIPTPDMDIWLRCMKRMGVQLCVVSNSHKSRAKKFCAGYSIPCITHAKKPAGKGIREAMELFGLQPEVCALAGDQIFTDVLGANCAGIRSILVRPIHNHNFWLKARHMLEKPFIFCARKRRIKL